MMACYFDRSSRRTLLTHLNGRRPVAEDVFESRVVQDVDLLGRAMRTDFCNYLPEDILVKVDRASMLTSLEVRAPFLDYRLIEFAFAKVPARLKATAQEKKILLKRLTAKVLPPEFDRHRKQGFSIPLTNWLKRGSFRKLFHDVIRIAATRTAKGCSAWCCSSCGGANTISLYSGSRCNELGDRNRCIAQPFRRGEGAPHRNSQGWRSGFQGDRSRACLGL